MEDQQIINLYFARSEQAIQETDIQQAQQLRSGQRKGASRTGRKRMLLAAIISLMLLLVGCAVVIASLQRVYMGRRGFSSTT